MSKILIFTLAVAMLMPLYAQEPAEMVKVKKEDDIFQSRHFYTIVSRVKENECVFSIKTRQKRMSRLLKAVPEKKELSVQTCSFRGVSCSESGMMLISFLTLNREADVVMQAYSPEGRLLWDGHYIDSPFDDKVRDVLLSPNGKYVILTNSDTCRIFSARDGKRIFSKLEEKIKGNYTAFFDNNSQVVIVCDDWRLLKYDPETDSIIAEKKIDDPTHGTLKMTLNRFRVRQSMNKDATRFVVFLIQEMPNGTGTNSWIMTFDPSSLNIRIFVNAQGIVSPDFALLNNDVLVAVYYKRDTTQFHETRLYRDAQTNPVIIDGNSKTDMFSHARMQGDDVFYRPAGSDMQFWKYNVKNRTLNRNAGRRIPLSEKDTTDVLELQD